MGTKEIHTGGLVAMEDVYEILNQQDALGWLKHRLLNNLSTSGAGDIVEVTELTEYIHDLVITAYSLRDGDHGT